MEVRFERESLYQEVWAAPITTLAKKYGLSDNGLRKVCAALAIPLPGRGHWAKVAAGHQLATPPLAPTEGRTFFVCRLPDPDPDGAAALRRDASLQERLAFESTPENSVTVPAELVKPHRLVAAANEAVRAQAAELQRSRDYEARPRMRGEPWKFPPTFKPSLREYEQRGVIEPDEGSLPVRVSFDAADRAFRIWDALLKACEARGLLVSAAPRQVTISDSVEHIGLRMSEKVDRVTRPATWSSGEETVRRNPTGRLRIFAIDIIETKFEDTPERLLEQQLNAILVWIHRALAVRRSERAIAAEKKRTEEAAAQARERERAAEAEATQLREEEQRRLQAEQLAAAERERLLLVEASAWRDAEAIRAYVEHLRAAGAASAISDWLSWAEAIADRMDPTTARMQGGTSH